VAGDLLEEFQDFQIARLGIAGARAWYWRQVLRSVYPLAGARLSPAVLALLLATAGQSIALDAGWCWVLSQVPLKESLERGWCYGVASLTVTFLATSVAGLACSPRGLLLTLPFAALCDLVGVWGARGLMPSPSFFPLAAATSAVAGVCCGTALKGFGSTRKLA
jgi:hypothetical protein